MTRLHWLNVSVCLTLTAVISLFVAQPYALLYGVSVSFINLLLSYGYFYWHQRHVVKRLGQSMSAVTHSMIVRTVVVCFLLMLGFRLFSGAQAMVIGFILGQFFYFLNQLIRIVEHGK